MIVKRIYWIMVIGGFILTALLQTFVWSNAWLLLIFFGLYAFIGMYDMHSVHNVRRNYPVLGHLRYMFEFVRPEIQQYFVATNLSGRPFNREVRSLIYQRAKHERDTHPFGTEHNIDAAGYQFTQHSMVIKHVPDSEGRILVGGPECKKPYLSSRINISAMSFGALSGNAIMALNRGAKLGDFAHNTGEGSVSHYHLKEGGDIIWQIGTGYFGCRREDGGFDKDKFKDMAVRDVVKMIEIKVSQGAKPSHGGLLPAAKITPEIARVRGIPIGEDCDSPPGHSEFSDPKGLLDFIVRLRELSGGKPIGFKLCVGIRKEFMGICKAMVQTGIKPDFITVDGAEGGTGAAPLEFTNRFGVPINEGLAFVHNCLVGCNLREDIKIIASGKVATAFDMVLKRALGADICNSARAMMMAVGCIQALACNTNECPTGVATQDPKRAKAVVVSDKGRRVASYHHLTMRAYLDMVGAMGLVSPNDLGPERVFQRQSEADSLTYDKVYHYLQSGDLLNGTAHEFYKPFWEQASADHF